MTSLKTRINLVMLAVVIIAIAHWGMPWVITQHRTSLSKENLVQIGAAIMAYEQAHRSFPPPYSVSESGERLHSWRVLILPFLGEKELYDKIDLDEPWDAPHNQTLLAAMPSVYRSPFSGFGDNLVETVYLAVVGKNTIWHPSSPRAVRDITDGVSQTGLIACNTERPVPWMSPSDQTLAALVMDSEENASLRSQRFLVYCHGQIRVSRRILSVEELRDAFIINNTSTYANGGLGPEPDVVYPPRR